MFFPSLQPFVVWLLRHFHCCSLQLQYFKPIGFIGIVLYAGCSYVLQRWHYVCVAADISVDTAMSTPNGDSRVGEWWMTLMNQSLVQGDVFRRRPPGEDLMAMRTFMWYIIHNNSNVYIVYCIRIKAWLWVTVWLVIVTLMFRYTNTRKVAHMSRTSWGSG